jgi:hypothetical protein
MLMIFVYRIQFCFLYGYWFFKFNLKGNFYDAHDIWHFLSAIALLLNCLIFFHLDFNAKFKGAIFGERTGINEIDDLNDVDSYSRLNLTNVNDTIDERVCLFFFILLFI